MKDSDKSTKMKPTTGIAKSRLGDLSLGKIAAGGIGNGFFGGDGAWCIGGLQIGSPSMGGYTTHKRKPTEMRRKKQLM